MIETVRLVSDGEELVSSQAETLHLRSDAADRASSRSGWRNVIDVAPTTRSAEPTRRPVTRTPPDGRR